jgi:cysteine desulfuration protein SufE
LIKVLSADSYFIEAIGLKEHLSPTRSNGLVAMLKQMKLYALAFKSKQ